MDEEIKNSKESKRDLLKAKWAAIDTSKKDAAPSEQKATNQNINEQVSEQKVDENQDVSNPIATEEPKAENNENLNKNEKNIGETAIENANSEQNATENQPIDNAKSRKKAIAKTASILGSVAIVVFTAILVMLMITSNVYKSATVVGKSMYPTINATTEGNDGAYYTLYKDASINDIVIIDYGSSGIATNVDAIKRLIAKGGDTICFYGGKILKNNKPIDDWYIQSAIAYKNQIGENGDEWATSGYEQCRSEFITFCERVWLGTSTLTTTFVQNCKSDTEFKNKHLRLDSTLNTFILTVPENYIFILGDNRANSTDSSDFGPLEEKYLLAKVDFILQYNQSTLQKIFQQFIHLFA